MFGHKVDEYEYLLRKKLMAKHNLKDTYSSLISKSGGNHQT